MPLHGFQPTSPPWICLRFFPSYLIVLSKVDEKGRVGTVFFLWEFHLDLTMVQIIDLEAWFCSAPFQLAWTQHMHH